MRAGAAVVLMLVAGACAGPPAPSPTEDAAPPSVATPTFVTHDDVLVIVGSDEDHFAVTQPLVEVFPPPDPDPAVLNLSFESVRTMGMEGGVTFASAHALDGTLVADQIVELAGDSLEIPGTELTVRFYYRACDGHCGLLDPAHELCTVEHAFDAGDVYDVSVDGSEAGAPRCRVEEIRED
jgi:hypothetical protein